MKRTKKEGNMNRVRNAIREVQKMADRDLEHLTDIEYVQVCEELETYFSACAAAKEEEMRRR